MLIKVTPTNFIIGVGTSNCRVAHAHSTIAGFRRCLRRRPRLPRGLVTVRPPLPTTSASNARMARFRYRPTGAFSTVTHIGAVLPNGVRDCRPLDIDRHDRLHHVVLYVSSASTGLTGLPNIDGRSRGLLGGLHDSVLDAVRCTPI